MQVLETENVVGFVRSSRNLISIPEIEMQTLKRIVMDDTLEWESTPELFAEGQPVTITSGHLAGMKGKLVKKEGKNKFVVELETIGHSMLIEMDAKWLQ